MFILLNHSIFGDSHDLYVYHPECINNSYRVHCGQSAYDYHGKQNALSGVNCYISGNNVEDNEVLDVKFEEK